MCWLSLIWLQPQQNAILIVVIFLQDVVNAICDDEDIKAISFVGSNIVSYLNWNNLNFILRFYYRIVAPFPLCFENPELLIWIFLHVATGVLQVIYLMKHPTTVEPYSSLPSAIGTNFFKFSFVVLADWLQY